MREIEDRAHSSSFPKRNRRLATLMLAICVSLLMAGCVESLKAHSSILTRLRNRGPVALSSDNPYLAANLMLSKEMELSPELKGFIEHRGVPSAIEIQHELFSPLIATLYYPAERQVYTLEETDKTWYIRGPTAMDGETLKKVLAVAAFQRPTGKLPEKPVEALATAAPAPTIEVVANPPAAEDLGFRSPAQPSQHVPAARAAVTDAELVSQLSRGHEKELAEISPKGDIVHYVTFPNETLVAIARWYTLDADNEGRIARINRIKEGYSLSLGDTIIIPSYLIRNKLRLTEQASQQLRIY